MQFMGNISYVRLEYVGVSCIEFWRLMVNDCLDNIELVVDVLLYTINRT